MRLLTFFWLLTWTMCLWGQSTLYVSPSGQASNAGTSPGSPTTLANAIANISTDGTIYLAGGTYSYSNPIVIQGKNGTSARIKVFADGGTPVLDFSAMPENSSNRGIVLDADYWHFRGIIIQEAGDNGMLLAGKDNIIEDCIFRRNHDTGLQLSRFNTNANSISQWPSDNLILNCESYDNRDSDNEDADGFAPKLTCGTGNVFQGCVAHHNIDDGWDLYTKSSTGPIGAVTLIDCIAHSNGVLTDGSTSGNGDKNGFKMGGEDIAVDHIMRRCIAFNNGKHGITYNRNDGSIEVSNCTGYNNEQRNFNFDGGNHVFKNNLSYLTGSNDRLIGNSSFPNAFDNDDSWGFTITSTDFVSLSPGPDSDPTSNGFLNLATSSDAVNAGVITTGITYNSSAPDLGAVESGGTTPPPPNTYTLSLSASPSAGGSVSASPSSSSYNDGDVVTITATPNSGYTFSNWSGDASGTNATLNLTMDANKAITAIFTATGGGGGGGGTNTNLGANLAITGPGAGSDGSSKASGSSYNNVRDGDINTVWSPSGTSNEEITVKWSGQVSSNTVILKEVGNNVTSWQLETREGVVLGSGSGIGSSLQVDYPDVSTDKIYLYIYSASATPQIGEFEVYDAANTGGGGGGTSYTLSVANNPTNGGSVSLSPAGGTYAAGTVVTLTANSATDYSFDNWSGDASGTSTSTTVTMNSNLSVTANYTFTGGGGGGGSTTLQLQENASGFCSVDGTVDSDNSGFTGSGFANTGNASGNGIEWAVNVPSAGSYTLEWRYANGGGSNRTGSVAVNGSQQIGNVDFNGTGSWTSWSTSSIATVNLAAGDNVIRLEATNGSGLANIDWMEVTGNAPSVGSCSGQPTTYTLSTSSNPANGGSIALSPSGGTYTAGTVVTLTASANGGFSFDNWSGDASGSSASTTVTMNGNLSVTANFSAQATTLQLQENASGFCSVDGTVDSDNSGFTGSGFANTDNASGNGVEWSVNVPSAGSYTLQWRYANGSSSNRTGSVAVDGSQQVSNVDFNGTGSWTSWNTSGSVNVNLASGDNTIRLEATNGSGLANIDWMEVTGNAPSAGSCSGGGGGTPTTYTLSVSNSPSNGGSVSLSPAGGTYPAGTVVTLTATPNSGYNFLSWGGDASGTSTTTTVTMNSNLSATASYQQTGGGGGGGGNADFSLVGYATLSGGTTGGAGGTYAVVSTGTDLQNAINNKGSQPLAIYVNGTITPGNSSGLSKIDVKDVSDISILGMGSGAEFDGIGIKVWRASNIIIRNLEIHHVQIGDKDCISIEGPSDHIWVDHCELYAEYQGVGKDDFDGLLDLKRDVDNVTFSWNYLHDSWKTSLSGSSESDTYNRQVTYHHNFYENCNSRLPLFRSGEGHIYNCYYKDVVSTGINSRINACIRIENNYFENVNNPWVSAYSDVLGAVQTLGNTLVNSPFDFSNSDINQALSCTLNVPYSYSSTLNNTSDVPGLLQQNAGVGVLNFQPPAAKTTGIGQEMKAWQESFRLAPNPNHGQFQLSFELPSSDQVQIALFNSLGQRVETLVNERFSAGQHEVTIDQSRLAADVYFVVATSKLGTTRTRMIIY